MLENGRELSARFVLVRRLGVGGSGEVWLARDRVDDVEVAVKVLPPEARQHSTAIAALEREYEILSALRHPNILRVLGVHRSAEHAWITMEYAASGNLSRLRGRPVNDVLRIAAPVAAALAYLHARGIVHRDVKPANVLLMSNGMPKLADYDAAHRVGASAERCARGSPFSMSPQQLEGAAPAPSDDVYALGATLYELLSGYPPFYPDATPERIRFEKPAALPASVPVEVADLIARMLAKTPAERPAMDTVESELKKLANVSENDRPETPPVRIEPPSVRAPGASGEPLRGEWHRSTAASASARDLRREGFRRGLAASAIGVGVLAVLVVFFALPRWVEDRQPASGAKLAPAATASLEAERAAEKKKEIDFAALARAKQEAEDLRGPLAERLETLREQAAEVWGGAELSQVNEAFAAGDKSMEAREYTEAVEHFNRVATLIDTLEQRAGEVLKAQLAAGATALAEGRSVDARNAFELAAKIDPKNEVAANGMKRASTLDAVLELLANGERLEKEDRMQEALDHYRKALALDAQTTRASEGLARVEARLANDAFASAMARGFSALAKADHASARSAFQEAGKIRPNAPEVAQALRQIEQEQRTNVIGTKLRAAQALEAQEQWADALKEYRSVLELDSTVAAANEGVARVSPRVALNEQLELYLTQPERLFSEPVRAAARESLARAQSIQNPGPVLQKQITTLGDWLARADIPVPVPLQSDNQTQVTIYRVGSLGTFQERMLELVPGRYTVVGTRPGYRDVRRQIDVFPGAALEPIVIRCEDKI
jgi:hypothetical protein